MLLDYLEHQIGNSYDILKAKSTNDEGVTLPHRNLYPILYQKAHDFYTKPQSCQWLVISGLRGVGKTMLLAQLFCALKEKYQNKINILYISLDVVVNRIPALSDSDLSPLEQILELYKDKILQTNYHQLNKPTFIFIDEIQFDADWSKTIKFYSDNQARVSFVCTGSSATQLQIEMESRRRFTYYTLNPLSFTEFYMLKHNKHLKTKLKTKLMNTLYFSVDASTVYRKLKLLDKDIKQQWSQYDRIQLNDYFHFGSLPFIFNHSRSEATDIIIDNLNKIIFSDLGHYQRFRFNAQSIWKIQQLLSLLAYSNGLVNLASLASKLQTNKTQLTYILDALIKAKVLNKTSAYSNKSGHSTSLARYNFTSPAIRNACLGVISQPSLRQGLQGIILEDLAILHYTTEFDEKKRGKLFYPAKSKQPTADFILKIANQQQIALEFSLQKNKSSTQIKKTLKKIECQYGLIFANGELALLDEKIVFVPLDYFYLL